LAPVDVVALTAGPPAERSDDYATPVARLTLGRPAGGIAHPIAAQLGDQTLSLAATDGVFRDALTRDVPLGSRGGLSVEASLDGEGVAVGAGVTLDRPLLRALSELGRSLASDEVPA